MLDPFGGAGDPKYDKPQVFKPGKGYSKLEPVVVNPPAAFTNTNVFASQPKDRFVPTAGQMKTSVAPSVNDPFFSKKDPVSMDTMVDVGGGQQKTQYRNLTDLMKMNMDSLSGKIRIRDDRFPDRKAYVPPGYDSDMVPFAVKISAARLGMDPKEYMNMSIMDRVKNFGTEAKSMGQELTTGVGQAIDAGKQLVSNLPMMSLLSGFLGSGGGEQQTTDNTGIMSNFTSSNPLEGKASNLIELGGGFQTDGMGDKPVDQNLLPDNFVSFLGQYVPNTLSGMMDQNVSYLSDAQLRAYYSMSPEEQSNFRSLESLTDKLAFLKSKFPDLK